MWLVFAILSSIFAALTSILAKVGIEGVDSNLATAIRTAVVLIMAWGMVFLTSAQNGIGQISQKSWTFLILSGLATGAANATRSGARSWATAVRSRARGATPASALSRTSRCICTRRARSMRRKALR